jgi:hypothetical protein
MCVCSDWSWLTEYWSGTHPTPTAALISTAAATVVPPTAALAGVCVCVCVF